MLDHLVLNELAGQIIMTKKYIKEDTVELICDDPAMPPHLHKNLTKQVYDKCHSRFEEIVQAHQPRHRPGGRRGRRTGGNRGGRNGGGHE
uniref:RNA helicase n=1 Tax=Meloidogyne floridensis TaxID=298350 RepID=A0A915P315_9BILA